MYTRGSQTKLVLLMFFTDPITRLKHFKRVDGTSSALCWYLWAHEDHLSMQKKCFPSFLCFSFNLQLPVYIALAKCSDPHH